MATKCILARSGNALVAADVWSSESIQAMSDGEIVTANITRTRNPQFHKKFFAFLNVIFENQSKYLTLEDMLEAMKEAIGLGRYIDRVDGRGSFFRSDSISFSKMDEDKFRKFYDAFVSIVVNHILPGVDEQSLRAEIESHLVGR